MPVITINGEQKVYAKGTTYEDIAKEYQKLYPHRIAAVIFNGKIRELMKTVKKDGELSFVTYSAILFFRSAWITGESCARKRVDPYISNMLHKKRL